MSRIHGGRQCVDAKAAPPQSASELSHKKLKVEGTCPSDAEEDAWLRELITVRRPAHPTKKLNVLDAELDEWLRELITVPRSVATCHRQIVPEVVPDVALMAVPKAVSEIRVVPKLHKRDGVVTKVPQFHSWYEVPKGITSTDELVQIDDTDAAFNHALHRLLHWRHDYGIITFKIGIAADTAYRWDNDVYGGYLAEGIWCNMDVVADGPANRCRQLEIDLIWALRGVPGCYNDGPGGEGVSPTSVHMCYLYIVIGQAGKGRSLKATAAEMQRGYDP